MKNVFFRILQGKNTKMSVSKFRRKNYENFFRNFEINLFLKSSNKKSVVFSKLFENEKLQKIFELSQLPALLFSYEICDQYYTNSTTKRPD